MAYKAFLRNYYLASFFYDFIFAYAIYNVLFAIRGLSVFEISLLLAWWALVAMLLEIPTGALADSWSRKTMLVLAPLIKALCFVTWFIADGNFYLYALGFVFWALGSAFVSGTTEALLFDTTVAAKRQEEYEQVLGRKKFYFHIGLAVATITGGFIAGYNIDWAIILSVIPLLLSSFFASRIQEVPKVESTGEIHYLEYIRIAFREMRSNRVLLYLFVYLFSISIFGSLEEFDQLYYQLAGLPLYAFGIAGFLWSMLNALGANYAYTLKRLPPVYYLLPLVSGILLVLVATFPSIPMIGVLLFTYTLTTPLKILTESKLQHSIRSVSRATITSASTLLVELLAIIWTLGYGVLARLWDLSAIYLATALFLFAFANWVFVVRNRVSVRTANG